MALNFPSSPTNGQQYQNWIYDSAKGAWEAKPLEAMAATPSATAPLTPQSGDMWYNTNDGGVYVYYNDGNTSQWVQMKSDATLSSTLGERTTTLENKLGLSRIIPPTVNFSGGSATANSLGTISFTAVTSLSLNDVFSSAYTNYQIVYSGVAAATGLQSLQFRLRTTSDAATNYYFSNLRTYVSGTTATFSSSGSTTFMLFGILDDQRRNSGSFSIHNPNIALPTSLSGTFIGADSTNNFAAYGGGFHAGSTQYTGFTIYPGGSSMTGTIQVFGYNS